MNPTLDEQVKAAVELYWKDETGSPGGLDEQTTVSKRSVIDLATRILTLCREDAQRREEEVKELRQELKEAYRGGMPTLDEDGIQQTL